MNIVIVTFEIINSIFFGGNLEEENVGRTLFDTNFATFPQPVDAIAAPSPRSLPGPESARRKAGRTEGRKGSDRRRHSEDDRKRRPATLPAIPQRPILRRKSLVSRPFHAPKRGPKRPPNPQVALTPAPRPPPAPPGPPRRRPHPREHGKETRATRRPTRCENRPGRGSGRDKGEEEDESKGESRTRAREKSRTRTRTGTRANPPARKPPPRTPAGTPEQPPPPPGESHMTLSSLDGRLVTRLLSCHTYIW